MSQPDGTKLVSFPAGKATGARRPRDPRIDAFRGLALVMIFIDHVPGNPYEYLTIRNFTHSDAAEAFFLMSGLAAALAYSGRLTSEARAEHGLWNGIAPMWKRSWTLYLAHIFMTVWAIAIFSAAAGIYAMPELLEQINLRQVFGNTGEALFGIAALTHQLGYVNILPAYSVLLLFAPLMLMIGLWRPWALLTLSLVIWMAAGLWRLNLPNFPNPGGWFFNPISWQLLFVLGALTGLGMRRGERFVPKSRALFWACLGFCVLALVWKFVPAVGDVINHQMARLYQAGIPFHLTTHDKTFVALPRLLNILALAYVLSCLPWVTRACAHKAAAPLRLLGQQGLLVFCTGTVVSLMFQVYMAGNPLSTWMGWGLPPLGIVIMLITAWLGSARKAAPRGSAPSAQGGLVASSGKRRTG
ncbi:OpgC protein [Salipiger sp. CCB-MM3]|uniref:OpgC family protein n=1 Tax=Salipiger sp. CCB-MM3 TaxID=1792508 RepID=UPI00080AA36A|nr:OpgC domain-containing protein [Salipiger sp. CCB-MM3]ANT59476.1 OpgC protein [Salipiger sp. CCB-MM3]